MNRPQQQQQIVQLSLPEPNQLVGLAVQGAGRFAKKNPIITGTYLFGWIFLLVVGNGTLLTVQQQREYNKIMVRRKKRRVLLNDVCVVNK
jgi:arginine exporter protein ArgO